MTQNARGESGPGSPGSGTAAPPFSDLDGARRYYRDWLGAAFPLWWETGADHVGGGFFEALTEDGRPALLAAPRRARVQARQVYVYANAGVLGWDGPWREAARHGLDFLLARHVRGPGEVAKSVFADGAPADGTNMLYEQAFTALALSAMAKIEPADAGLREEGARFREAICKRLHRGGYREGGDQPYQANSQMHLLEAALAWEEAGDASWSALADAVARLALGRFIDPERGVLREFFDEAWRPAPGEAGRLIEPGHQFEWAWLLARWGRARGEAAAAEAAQRLYAAGLAGVEARRGVVVGELWDDLTLKDGLTRLWPQTEWLRAALAFGDAAGATRAAQGLARFLETPAKGAWRDKLGPDGAFRDEPAPATSFYHILGACLELLRFETN